jgi:antirestriction protein ArdC
LAAAKKLPALVAALILLVGGNPASGRFFKIFRGGHIMAGQSVYDIITEEILKIMEQGVVPWRKPWNSKDSSCNLVSGKPYRGINVFLLSCAGFNSPWWLTYRQAQEKGGQVRKGEKGRRIIFWKLSGGSEETEAEENKSRKIPLLKYYTVFNLQQVEGVEIPPEPERVVLDPIANAEAIVKAMPDPPAFSLGNRAAYNLARDLVIMPDMQDFHGSEEYYSTLFHELAHATGHQSRLNRKEITDIIRFGSHNYSKEELVAEMTASFLCGEAGILPATIQNSASYLQSWAAKLKEDKKMVVCAAAAAQRAADYILVRQGEE